MTSEDKPPEVDAAVVEVKPKSHKIGFVCDEE